jgi:hypothetical protein
MSIVRRLLSIVLCASLILTLLPPPASAQAASRGGGAFVPLFRIHAIPGALAAALFKRPVAPRAVVLTMQWASARHPVRSDRLQKGFGLVEFLLFFLGAGLLGTAALPSEEDPSATLARREALKRRALDIYKDHAGLRRFVNIAELEKLTRLLPIPIEAWRPGIEQLVRSSVEAIEAREARWNDQAQLNDLPRDGRAAVHWALTSKAVLKALKAGEWKKFVSRYQDPATGRLRESMQAAILDKFEHSNEFIGSQAIEDLHRLMAASPAEQGRGVVPFIVSTLGVLSLLSAPLFAQAPPEIGPIPTHQFQPALWMKVVGSLLIAASQFGFVGSLQLIIEQGLREQADRHRPPVADEQRRAQQKKQAGVSGALGSLALGVVGTIAWGFDPEASLLKPFLGGLFLFSAMRHWRANDPSSLPAPQRLQLAGLALGLFFINWFTTLPVAAVVLGLAMWTIYALYISIRLDDRSSIPPFETPHARRMSGLMSGVAKAILAGMTAVPFLLGTAVLLKPSIGQSVAALSAEMQRMIVNSFFWTLIVYMSLRLASLFMPALGFELKSSRDVPGAARWNPVIKGIAATRLDWSVLMPAISKEEERVVEAVVELEQAIEDREPEEFRYRLMQLEQRVQTAERTESPVPPIGLLIQSSSLEDLRKWLGEDRQLRAQTEARVRAVLMAGTIIAGDPKGGARQESWRRWLRMPNKGGGIGSSFRLFALPLLVAMPLVSAPLAQNIRADGAASSVLWTGILGGVLVVVSQNALLAAAEYFSDRFDYWKRLRASGAATLYELGRAAEKITLGVIGMAVAFALSAAGGWLLGLSGVALLSTPLIGVWSLREASEMAFRAPDYVPTRHRALLSLSAAAIFIVNWSLQTSGLLIFAGIYAWLAYSTYVKRKFHSRGFLSDFKKPSVISSSEIMFRLAKVLFIAQLLSIVLSFLVIILVSSSDPAQTASPAFIESFQSVRSAFRALFYISIASWGFGWLSLALKNDLVRSKDVPHLAQWNRLYSAIMLGRLGRIAGLRDFDAAEARVIIAVWWLKVAVWFREADTFRNALARLEFIVLDAQNSETPVPPIGLFISKKTLKKLRTWLESDPELSAETEHRMRALLKAGTHMEAGPATPTNHGNRISQILGVKDLLRLMQMVPPKQGSDGKVRAFLAAA